MKYYLKLIMILPVSLFVAIIMYPFMHELSHTICAIAMGANLVDFSLFPLPNVICDVGTMSSVKLFFVAVSGTMLPLLLCTVIRGKNFWVNYMSLLVTGISIMSFSISIFGFIFTPELILEQDDIVRFSTFIIGGTSISIVICIFGILISIVTINKTIKRCNFFNYFTR